MSPYVSLAFCLFGFLLGMAVVILVFVALNSRFNFWVPYQPVCVSDQYINNPSRAIQEGYRQSDILSVNTRVSPPQMLYKRPNRASCTPGSNQTIRITYPQQCSFTQTDGTVIIARDEFFEANRYRVTGSTDVIETSGDCQPRTAGYTSGVIVNAWT